ncbi:ANTAR domain-containing protein [Actinomadura scrupuli]|uniref:ANTAR domain-containing protein n=1 Tax=Actinomadura scrupuli TaxID=559629 RepID=UPI003D97309A
MTARLEDLSAHLEDLQGLLDEEEDLDEVLERLTAMAVQSMPDASHVSITVMTGDHTRTAAATEQSVIDIDQAQYDAGEGPCVQAARQRRPMLVRVSEVRDRWPAFARAAEAAGMLAYLSAPLLLDGDDPVVLGAVNLAGTEPNAFDPLDEALLTVFTTAASGAIMNARRYHRSRELVGHMTAALSSRADIDQAKGVLMTRHGVNAEQAFELLVIQSQHTNRRLRDVARSVLDSVVAHSAR